MSDPYRRPTLAEDRERGAGTAEAEPIGPSFLGSIGPGFDRARSGEDWGWNQIRYEGRVTDAIDAEMEKRKATYLPNAEQEARRIRFSTATSAYAVPAPSLRELEDEGIEARLAWAADVRSREPGFLPEFADITDRKGLRAWALERRREDMSAADDKLRGGSFAGQLVGALGAAPLDPTSYIPIGGGGGAVTSIGRAIVNTGTRAAGANMAFSLALEPMVRDDARALGVNRTWVQTGTEVGIAGLFGFALGGTIGGVSQGFKQRRGRAATGADREALDAFDAAVPPDMRTPDEAAAAAVVERAVNDAETSPFVPDPAGDAAHATRLEDVLDAMVNGRPVPATAAPVPAPRVATTQIAVDSRNGAMNFIMDRIEGGDKITTDSGGLTRFGVSQKAFPGLDIRNLSRAQAEQIYIDKYWRPLKLDGVAMDIGLVAFDAAINHGVGFARRMLRDGQMDPARMLAIRRAEYARLVAADPGKYGRYERGWENRLQAVEHRLGWSGEAPARSDAPAPRFAELDIDVPDIEVPTIRTDAFDDAGDGRGVMGEYLAGSGGLPTTYTDRFTPDEIEVDAATMQFKAGGDTQGVTDRLQGVTQWEPAFAGRVMVWESLDGRRLIADGHQRLGLAKRIAAVDPAQDIRLDALVMREADGITARDARGIAAMKNMAEGSGTAIDAAKVARDFGPEMLGKIPPRSTIARDARPLAQLGDDAFGLVVNELVPAPYAAIVGRMVPDDPAQQTALLQLLMETGPANMVQAEAVVRQGIDAGFVSTEQFDMFGGRAGMSAKFIARARILDGGIARLKKLKLVYTTAASEADTLESVGSSIARSPSEQEAIANAQAIAIVQRLANARGPVKDALDLAAASAGGRGGVRSAIAQFVSTVRTIDLADATRASDDAGPAGGAGDGGGRAGGADQADAAISSPDADAAVARAEIEAETPSSLFDDPVGPEARAQSDSLQHDLGMLADDADQAGFRLDAEGDEMSLRDLLATLDEDEAAAAIMRGCMKPGGGQ